MPNQDQHLSYNTQFKRLKEKQEIMPADLNEFDKTKRENQAFIQHNSIEETKKELAFIDKLLTGSYMKEEEDKDYPKQFRLKLSEEDYMLLSNRKTMGLSNILLNNHSKEDSKEMTNVKVDILNFAKVMESCKALPPTPENLDMIDVAIRMAIDSCRTYCDSKHPRFKTGIARKEMVKEIYQNLIFESELFSFKRREMAKGKEEIKLPSTIGEMFGFSEQAAIERPMTKKEVKEAQKRERQQAAARNNQAGNQAVAAPKITYPEEVKYVKEIFGEGYDFAAKIKTKYKADKDIRAKSREVKELYDALKLFTPGNVAIANVKVLGKNVKLLQKSDNSTYILVDHKEYPLERTFATTCNQIEKEIFNSTEVYGNDQLEKLLNDFERKAKDGKMTSGENNRIRTMLAEYLNQKTGLAVNDFNNTFRNDMATYIKDILRGRPAQEIKNEVIENSKSNLFINGVAISEMVLLNSNKSIDEIKEMVEMKTQVQKEVIEPDWSLGEQKVKNLISDLIYSNDTEKMDAAVKNPGAYIRDMLDKHKDALKAIKDSKTDPEAYIKGILQKMSLDNLSANVNGNNLKLDSVLSSAMAVLIDFADDGEIDDVAILEIKKELDKAVDESCQILQQNVAEISGVIFEKVPQDENYDDLTLKEKVGVISKSSHGQGLFTENVFNSYFAKMNNVDKRAMLAAVIRTAKKVPDTSFGSDDDLIDEIKASKPARFIKTFERLNKVKQGKGNETYELNDEQKEALNSYREFRHKVRIQSNFLAGLIRGAGPLMHKMMQGLPSANLPEEIKEALSDVKDNLPPIPDHIVQAEFMSLVESSHGNITKIKKEKSLGAASVGETFLCKVYGPRPDMKNGKEVVIKLIRPEAKNRMQREETVMLEAAQKTDKAMYLTYKGQLENYKKELDLSVEAHNCNEGVKNYTDKFADVKTMKVMDDVPATSNSLIVEKAEGVTLKKYIEDLWKYSDDLLGKFYNKEEESDGIVIVKKALFAEVTPDERKELMQKQKLIINKIEEAKKRRDHIINLCDAWIDQAIMNDKSGFYHGDLHSGNIMISDKEATFIDYGNTVQLTQKQQISIAQMALAATVSVAIPASDNPAQLFFDAFNDLLTENQDPEFKDLYTEEKKKDLKDAFTQILQEGNEEEAGYRISLCLAKAQELGIMLPAAIQNFSQGQVRLQNSLDEMNAAIEYLEKSLDKIDTAGYLDQDTWDPITHMIAIVGNDLEVTDFVEGFKGHINNLLPMDETTFKTALVDNTKKKADVEKGIKAVDKRRDFQHKFTDKYISIDSLTVEELQAMGLTNEQLQELGYDTSELKPVETYRQVFMRYYETYKDKMDDPEKKDLEVSLLNDLIPQSYTDQSLDAFGGANYFIKTISDALVKMDKDLMEECLSIYENQVPKALLLRKKTEMLWSKQDAKKLTKEEQDQLTNEIYTTYNELHNTLAKNDPFLTKLSVLLDTPNYEDFLGKDIKHLFTIEHEGLGKRLQEKFEAYNAIKKRNPIKKVPIGKTFNREWVVAPEDAQNYKNAVAEFMDAYAEISKYCLKEYVQDMYSKEISVKYVDYNTVMKNVMNRKFPLEKGGVKEKLGAFKLVGNWLGPKAKEMIKELAIENGVSSIVLSFL